jgi:hypothetical protein
MRWPIAFEKQQRVHGEPQPQCVGPLRLRATPGGGDSTQQHNMGPSQQAPGRSIDSVVRIQLQLYWFPTPNTNSRTQL